MRKILLLGGSIQQITAIECAKKHGYYTVLCDYLPDNPGQHYADKFYCVSTTDKDAILKVAKEERINGIVAYASDPAAPTAAFVGEKMGLPTNPYRSVEILANKDMFRKFLKNNGFNSPYSQSFSSFTEAKESICKFTLPVMVKPIDSSGSKGVKKVETLEEFEIAYEFAMNYSRVKKVIVEEFISKNHEYMIGGDCFVLNSKVEFWGLLNCHRNANVNPWVPVGKSYPIIVTDDKVNRVKTAIQRLVDLLDIRFGGFNIEIMFNNRDELFFIEMGPRNGGNMIPDLLNMITGVDLVAATIGAAMGNFNIDLTYEEKKVYFATYNLHSSIKGVFTGVRFNPKVKKRIKKSVIYKNVGDPVYYFDGANKAIGVVFFESNSLEQMLFMMDNPNEWVRVLVE